jgi:cytochrome c biogenesis protein ResB
MTKFRRAVMWAALALIILLIFLSIYGAFLGPAQAKNFFNSFPLIVYWLALALLLIIGIVIFRQSFRIPGLLLIHCGCILILAGSIWGSEAGHKLQKHLLGTDKIPKGRMVIFEGHCENRVILENDEQTKELPFSIKLRDLRIEYYKPEYIRVQTHRKQNRKIHPEDKFLPSHQRIVRDYISELEVIKDGEVLAEKNIEVNHPLHFGGYHFYQHSYDTEANQYTILLVVSDTGLTPVYAGYLMLCAGVFRHFWLRQTFTKIKLKSE